MGCGFLWCPPKDGIFLQAWPDPASSSLPYSFLPICCKTEKWVSDVSGVNLNTKQRDNEGQRIPPRFFSLRSSAVSPLIDFT